MIFNISASRSYLGFEDFWGFPQRVPVTQVCLLLSKLLLFFVVALCHQLCSALPGNSWNPRSSRLDSSGLMVFVHNIDHYFYTWYLGRFRWNVPSELHAHSHFSWPHRKCLHDITLTKKKEPSNSEMSLFWILLLDFYFYFSFIY